MNFNFFCFKIQFIILIIYSSMINCSENNPPKLLNVFKYSIHPTGITHLWAPLAITILGVFTLKGTNWLINKFYPFKHNKKINKILNIAGGLIGFFIFYKFFKSHIHYKNNFLDNTKKILNSTTMIQNIDLTKDNINIHIPGFGVDQYLKKNNIKNYTYKNEIPINIFLPNDVSIKRLTIDTQQAEAKDIINYIKPINNPIHLSAFSTGAQTLGLALKDMPLEEIKKIEKIDLLAASFNKDSAEGYSYAMKQNPSLKINNHIVLTDTIASANLLSKISLKSFWSFFKTILNFGEPMNSNMLKPDPSNQYKDFIYFNPEIDNPLFSHNQYVF
jgi:hypothetical protein